MDKLVIRKLPREFLNSIPIIKIKEEEDPEKFPNWIVKDAFEENSEFNIENFPEEDTGLEMEENVLKMDNQFFVCVCFDRIILTTTIGCIFECRQQIAMRFNRNVSLDDIKERISAKFVRRCGKRISKLFYKLPVLTNLIKFTEIELVDDEDVETMIVLYCGNWSDQNAPIQLFAELASVEPTEDLTALGEEHGA
ncbi:hypothetical protein J1N35_041861 [Gossypium stocksii]|uniref:Uncharacterized protein n=1 Tax=Gossypium stocksii TaxID=47602 RepID=A0A9D3UI92_9ROSI|nr:hypothetical protein J1N35_041861 [Gossypium stocksii]